MLASDQAIADLSPLLEYCLRERKDIFDPTELTHTPVAQFYDMDLWDRHLHDISECFGSTVEHRIAIKSNSLTRLLMHTMKKFPNFGIECASIGEVLHAVNNCGLEKERVVFDSPCKTQNELYWAIKERIYCNIDNFAEFERAKTYIEGNPTMPTGVIGFRVNPLVGGGSIAALSVSTTESKFGVPITERERLLEVYASNSWLNSCHVHVGSCSGLPLVDGIRIMVDFALAVNAKVGRQQVTHLDIGGGLSANYASDLWATDKTPSHRHYADSLRNSVPKLFSGDFKVVTEFGQSLSAKCGVIVSRVEWVKGTVDRPIPTVHFGADMCPRQAYTQDHKRRLEAYRCDGTRFPEGSPCLPMNVAGPLCFQGDFVALGAVLPKSLASGDFIVMKDAGANTLSLFSRHCSRLCPAAYGYHWNPARTEVVALTILKEREPIQDVFKFWGLP